MKALTVAGAGIRRLLRDRTALFFMIVLPILIIVVIGTVATGGDRVRVGLADQGSGPLGTRLAADIEHSPALDVRRFHDQTALARAVRRAEVVTGIVIPADLDASLQGGGSARVMLLAEPGNPDQQAARAAIQAVVGDHAALIQAGRFAAGQAGVAFEQGLEAAQASVGRAPVAAVRISTTGGSKVLPKGFGYSAPTMLVLFVFINAVAGASSIIESRQLGIHGRALEAIPPRTIVAGEVLCALATCLIQAGIIVVVGSAAFGVSWGSTVGATALILTWALVGAGAGVLCSSVFRTPEQATAIGPTLGVALGMLGGCMWPLQIVGPGMRAFGHLFPHAWAVDGFIVLTSQHGGLADITRQLAVLGAFAAGLLLLATLQLGRRLTA